MTLFFKFFQFCFCQVLIIGFFFTSSLFGGGYLSFSNFPIPIVVEANASYEDFRGVSEGFWNGNTGAFISLNAGFAPIDIFGLQIGASYGLYNWYGRGSALSPSYEEESQGFVTVGIFRNAQCDFGIHSALVYDWMYSRNFGVFCLDPKISQVRAQLAYQVFCNDEAGLFATLSLDEAKRDFAGATIKFRAINQINLFWRRFFLNGSEGMFWIGTPYTKSMMIYSKNDRQYIAGASFRCPLTGSVTIDGHAVYMTPPGSRLFFRTFNNTTNVCIGLTYHFGTGAKTCEDLGKARPYLPLANNSNFLVDTNYNF